MIGRLSGTLLEKHAPSVLVDVQGVGYEVDTPLSTFYVLPVPGSPVTLHTHLIVREDAHLLYGFATEDERRVFRMLIRLTGVGAKLALAILSGLSVDELGRAVAEQTTARLTAIPGIGKKTAERLLLELKGRVDALPTGAAAGPRSGDVLEALVALGYTEREAARAVTQLPAGLAVNDAIRQALKTLTRA